MPLPITHMALDPADFEDDDDLSDEQMQALLQRAEKRMRAAVIGERPPEDVLQLQDPSFEGVTESLSKISKLKAGALAAPYVSSTHGVAHTDPRRLLKDGERRLSNQPRRVENPVDLKEKKIKEKKATAGPDWYNLPKTKLTPELKRDLQLLKMRGVLDSKRHYKKDDSKTLVPEFSQVGTIVEGPAEFFSSRVPNKERKRTFVEEILGDERSTGRFKNKYKDIQALKTSGKKAFYKKLKEKRCHGVHKR